MLSLHLFLVVYWIACTTVSVPSFDLAESSLNFKLFKLYLERNSQDL